MFCAEVNPETGEQMEGRIWSPPSVYGTGDMPAGRRDMMIGRGPVRSVRQVPDPLRLKSKLRCRARAQQETRTASDLVRIRPQSSRVAWEMPVGAEVGRGFPKGLHAAVTMAGGGACQLNAEPLQDLAVRPPFPFRFPRPRHDATVWKSNSVMTPVSVQCIASGFALADFVLPATPRCALKTSKHPFAALANDGRNSWK